MRSPINSDRRHKFIELVGNGLDPYEAYPLAGYATSGSESGWKANCRSLCARLRSELDAALVANNLPESRKRQTGDLTFEESDELLSLARENLQRAREQNNVGAVTKLLRQVERLTRKSARGRPALLSSTASVNVSRVVNTGKSSDEIMRLVLGEEYDAIGEAYADYDAQRATWLNGGPPADFKLYPREGMSQFVELNPHIFNDEQPEEPEGDGPAPLEIVRRL